MGMCVLYEGCALPALVGSTLAGSYRVPQNIGRLQPATSLVAAIRRSRNGLVPLYRPRGNLAMLHSGLAKLMRMSTRHMW